MTEAIKPIIPKPVYCERCGRKLTQRWQKVGHNKRGASAYDDKTGELNYFRLLACPLYSQNIFAMIFWNSIFHTSQWEKTLIASEVEADKRSAV